MECLKCSGQAIDEEDFCFAHSSDIDAKADYIEAQQFKYGEAV